MASILVRSLLSFMAGLWLVNVTPFDQILATLSVWGMPRLIVAIMAFMYRYIFVVFDELQRMLDARRARSFGGQGWWQTWVVNAHLIGMLLIRSLDRAERVYAAMCARGWDGHVRPWKNRENG
jgi:cobalt/nickel transport system permease protein